MFDGSFTEKDLCAVWLVITPFLQLSSYFGLAANNFNNERVDGPNVL